MVDEFRYGMVLFEVAEDIDTAMVSTKARTRVF